MHVQPFSFRRVFHSLPKGKKGGEPKRNPTKRVSIKTGKGIKQSLP